MENTKFGQALAADQQNVEEETWNELLKLLEGDG